MIYGAGILKGFYITLLNFARSRDTVQYPDRRVGLLGAAKNEGVSAPLMLITRPRAAFKALTGAYVVRTKTRQSTRFRGNEFTWFEDRCTGCASCAKYCPLGTIEIVTHPGGFDMQEGESYAIDVFSIDTGRCMFCGLCVEACPYDALHMGTVFERSEAERGALVVEKSELNANQKRPSSWFRPQLEESEYNPFVGAVEAHKAVGRHEQPTDEELNDEWVGKRS